MASSEEQSHEPTLREMRATYQRLLYESVNHGGETGRVFRRAADHFGWLLDAFLFDTDDTADDGGREQTPS